MNLISNDETIPVGKRLACLVGVEGAMILQQIHFLCLNRNSGKMIDGDRWVWNTYEQWQRDHFPFWSARTIERKIMELEKAGYVLSCQPDKHMSRKKYYRVATSLIQNATYEASESVIPYPTMEGAKLAGWKAPKPGHGRRQIGGIHNRDFSETTTKKNEAQDGKKLNPDYNPFSKLSKFNRKYLA